MRKMNFSSTVRIGVVLSVSAIAFGMMSFGGVRVAHAQSAQELDKRMTAVEKQLRSVQRRVFQGGEPVGDEAGMSAGSVTAASVSLADMQARLAEIETQMRILTGQLEESNYRFSQLQQQYDKFTQDVEFRFGQLEKQGGTGPVTGSAPAAQSNEMTSPAASSAMSSGVSSGAPTLGAQHEKLKAQAKVSALPADPTAAYEQAYAHVRTGQYAQAEQQLGQFLEKYPDHELAGNAKYWLGQVYFVQKQYEQAAMTFLEGYKAFPDNPKAPSFLLKIGMTLGAMGESFEACEAFRELQQRFPKSDESRNRLSEQLKKFDCK